MQQRKIAEGLASHRNITEEETEHSQRLIEKRDRSFHTAVDETMKLMKLIKLSDEEHLELLVVAENALKSAGY